MILHYSPSNGLFWPEDLSSYDSDTLPTDFITVTYDDYWTAVTLPPGYKYRFEQDGTLVKIPPPFSFYGDPIKKTARDKVNAILGPLSWFGIAAQRADDAGVVDTYLSAWTAMRNLTIIDSVANADTIDDLNAAISAELARIAATLPDDCHYLFA